MSNRNKAKLYKKLAKGLKYVGWALIPAGVVAGAITMAVSSIITGVVVLFSLGIFGAASLVSSGICEVYANGYSAKAKEELDEAYRRAETAEYETEHEFKLDKDNEICKHIFDEPKDVVYVEKDEKTL